MAAAAVIAAIGTALGVVGTAVGPILAQRSKNKKEAQDDRLETIREIQMNASEQGAKSFIEENKTVILIALSALSVLFIFKQNFSK